jgi:hypothetical protein
MESLGDHEGAVDDEEADDGVHLKSGTLEQDTEWHLVQDPALRDPVCHQGIETQRSGDGSSLKVVGLAGRVVGDVGHGHVEAGETSQSAEYEVGQEDVIQSRAKAQRESDTGGGQTERDLLDSMLAMSL